MGFVGVFSCLWERNGVGFVDGLGVFLVGGSESVGLRRHLAFASLHNIGVSAGEL